MATSEPIELKEDSYKPNEPQVGSSSSLPPEEIDRLTDDIVAALKTVYDPEIPPISTSSA